MPPAPGEAAAATASASASEASPKAAAAAQPLFDAATVYASRCHIFHSFADPGYDLCTRIEHCPEGVTRNFKKAPCGFSEQERRAAVDAGKKAAALLEDPHLVPTLATFLKHVELFGQWVDDTTDIGGCIQRSPYGEYYCYERTRGTLSMYQDLARAFYRYRPAKDAFVLPKVYSSLGQAPPYHPLSDEVRQRGLPWGRCPSGICLVADRMQYDDGW